MSTQQKDSPSSAATGGYTQTNKDNHMEKQAIISDLKSINQSYSEKSKADFQNGDHEQGMKYGNLADVYGEAALSLENGATVKQVNERYNGICDF